jgi:hypothetical protein
MTSWNAEDLKRVMRGIPIDQIADDGSIME